MKRQKKLPLSGRWRPQQIVSGGQTGVDRAALDAAEQLGIEHGGWCPRGRRAEDGVIPDAYRLRELPSDDYAARTEQNVIDSDATLILYEGRLEGGTLLTRRFADERSRPWLLVKLSRPPSAEDFERWLMEFRPSVLNVAGPRESSRPGITERAKAWLVEHLSSENP
jgi:hypothetical protein